MRTEIVQLLNRYKESTGEVTKSHEKLRKVTMKATGEHGPSVRIPMQKNYDVRQY